MNNVTDIKALRVQSLYTDPKLNLSIQQIAVLNSMPENEVRRLLGHSAEPGPITPVEGSTSALKSSRKPQRAPIAQVPETPLTAELEQKVIFLVRERKQKISAVAVALSLPAQLIEDFLIRQFGTVQMAYLVKKVTPEVEARMRELHKQGESISGIARKLSLATETVRRHLQKLNLTTRGSTHPKHIKPNQSTAQVVANPAPASDLAALEALIGLRELGLSLEQVKPLLYSLKHMIIGYCVANGLIKSRSV